MSRVSIAAAISGLLLAICCTATIVVGGKTWIVGDGKGWNFGVDGWEKDKPIALGDELVFDYNNRTHNLVEADMDAYITCKLGDCKMDGHCYPTHTSGNDRIKLTWPGKAYFICSIPGHCEKGMKLTVNPR